MHPFKSSVTLGTTVSREISVALNELGLPGSATVRDVWNRKDLGVVTGSFTQTINSHGAGLFRLQPHN